MNIIVELTQKDINILLTKKEININNTKLTFKENQIDDFNLFKKVVKENRKSS